MRYRVLRRMPATTNLLYYNVAMRLFASATLLCATLSAQASFEMLMVLDVDTTRHVDRFDPLTGAYLGRFNVASNISSIEAVKSRGMLYGTGPFTNFLYEYNYSTGVSTRVLTLSQPISGLQVGSGGTLFGMSSSSVFRIDTNNGNLTSVPLPIASSVQVFTQLPSGDYIVGNNASGFYRSSNLSTWTSLGGAGLMPTAGVRDSVAISYTNGQSLVLYPDGTATRFLVLSSSQTLVTSGTWGDGQSAMGRGYAKGHYNAYAVADSPTLATDVIRTMTIEGTNGDLLTPSQLTNTSWATSVVAPEPASLMALVGLAALAKRRKR